MGLFTRTPAAVETPAGPSFSCVPETTLALFDRMTRMCNETPQLADNSADLFERAESLSAAFALLEDREAGFLKEYAERTMHSMTREGQNLVGTYPTDDPSTTRNKIGLTRYDVTVNDHWLADLVRPITAMKTIVALRGQPRVAGEPDLYGRYYAWQQPEAVAIVIDLAGDLIEARSVLERAAAELDAQARERLTQMARYQLLEAADRQVVDAELALALENHTDADHRRRVAFSARLTGALRYGLHVAVHG